ncbi:hypothetical protein DL96DRAFT_1564765 [Flagelloscypha sp. PMI_526]|nr:hypothetical protein DL96DRAFT_1564765 [Flagelloscypha sp. PMI_526]
MPPHAYTREEVYSSAFRRPRQFDEGSLTRRQADTGSTHQTATPDLTNQHLKSNNPFRKHLQSTPAAGMAQRVTTIERHASTRQNDQGPANPTYRMEDFEKWGYTFLPLMPTAGTAQRVNPIASTAQRANPIVSTVQRVNPVNVSASTRPLDKIAAILTYHGGELENWDLAANRDVLDEVPAHLWREPAVKMNSFATKSIYIRIVTPRLGEEFMFDATYKDYVRVEDVLRTLKTALESSWSKPEERGSRKNRTRVVDVLHPNTLYLGFEIAPKRRDGRIILELVTGVPRHCIFLLAILAVIDKICKIKCIFLGIVPKNSKGVYYEDYQGQARDERGTGERSSWRRSFSTIDQRTSKATSSTHTSRTVEAMRFIVWQ